MDNILCIQLQVLCQSHLNFPKNNISDLFTSSEMNTIFDYEMDVTH